MLPLTLTAALFLTANICKQRKRMWYIHLSKPVTEKKLLLYSYDIFKIVTLMNERNDSKQEMSDRTSAKRVE